MAHTNGLDAQHLMKMLGELLHKEQEKWNPKVFKVTGHTEMEVLGQHRDRIVKWILSLNKEFRFLPETLGLCISLLDRFLNLVKVRPKYLPCVAISCLYIAAKTLEEDEVIPSTVDLVKTINCVCTVAEVLRMEAIVLNKLSWDIKRVTPVDFLHVIHSLLMYYHPQLLDVLCNVTPSQLLTLLTRKTLNCLSLHQLSSYRPSVITLAVVSLELEQITTAWLSICVMVQKMLDINMESFVKCREIVGQFLSQQGLLQSGYKFRSIRRSKSMKRKAIDDDDYCDEIYEGIKRLYNEDVSMEFNVDMRMSCGKEVNQHQDIDPRNNFCIPAVSAN
ncbi:hypothetical protein FSP39_001580 [Pinctada imbricata]|uniref:Cyclin-like domain-containing protein n=1 Tax=Pinctada imbricata TaxID=66713 RepID=A0AA88YH19_PINIB|nr:hypothetical protein FSP39_001580 [Pinctada imbricata]